MSKLKGIKQVGAFPTNTQLKRQEEDFYATHPSAIDVLQHIVKLDNNIWEPAAGMGHLSNRLKEFNFNVKCSDLIVRQKGIEKLDFFKYDKLIDGEFKGDIVTNPPFCELDDFIIKAQNSCSGIVCVFLRIGCFATQKRYHNVFKILGLKKVILFSHSITCARDGNFDKYKGGAVQYAWAIFDKNFKGEVILNLVGEHRKYDKIKRELDYV